MREYTVGALIRSLKGSRGADQTTTSSSIAFGDVIVIVDFVCALHVICDSLKIFFSVLLDFIELFWSFSDDGFCCS